MSINVQGVPEKKVTDLIMVSAKNLALIDRKQSLNYSSIVNLKMDRVSAVNSGRLRF